MIHEIRGTSAVWNGTASRKRKRRSFSLSYSLSFVGATVFRYLIVSFNCSKASSMTSAISESGSSASELGSFLERIFQAKGPTRGKLVSPTKTLELVNLVKSGLLRMATTGSVFSVIRVRGFRCPPS